jgi:hypothetical protein
MSGADVWTTAELGTFDRSGSLKNLEEDMALFEDMFKGNVGTGVAVAGAMLLAPTVMPVVGRILRPVAKAVIKTGMVAYREAMEGVGDVTGDLIAEARSELRQDEHGKDGGVTGDTDATTRRRGATGTGTAGKAELPA